MVSSMWRETASYPKNKISDGLQKRLKNLNVQNTSVLVSHCHCVNTDNIVMTFL